MSLLYQNLMLYPVESLPILSRKSINFVKANSKCS